MNGATQLAKNFRRQGIRSKVNGKPNPEHPHTGPTIERIAKAQSHYVVGDDQRGNRVYHFHDCPLDRLYSRLTRQADPLSTENGLRREYTALVKYRHHWFSAGLQDAIGSADLNRIFASDPGSMSGMAKTERQAHHRQQYRSARDAVGHRPGIVLDNIVCAELTLELAGSSVGYGSYYKNGGKTYASPYRAREEATKLLRQAAITLANYWGIS
jgi:hypothetical protein